MLLSAHFYLSEFTASPTADERNIDNTPDAEEVANLQRLCVEVLEPLRAHLNKPIQISSGYRCIALNRAIGSKDTSEHIDGRAADIKVAGLSPLEVCKAIVALNLPFRQCIHEHKSWTHVSIPEEGQAPVRQTLTYANGAYRQGLH